MNLNSSFLLKIALLFVACCTHLFATEIPPYAVEFVSDLEGKSIADLTMDEKTFKEILEKFRWTSKKEELLLKCIEQEDNPAFLKLLLEAGADINYRNPQSYKSPLLVAITMARLKNHRSTFDFLLEQEHLDVNIEGKLGSILSPLGLAAGDSDLFEKIVRHPSFEPNREGELSNSTPLRSIIKSGDLSPLPVLMRYGVDINYEDSRNSTPLILAVFHGDSTLVKLLVENGADPNKANRLGLSPLCFALNPSYYDEDVLKALLGSDKLAINARTPNGSLPIISLSPKTWKSALPLLLERGLDINAEDKNGLSLYKLAQAYGDLEMIAYLRRHLFISVIQNKEDMSDFMRACSKGDFELVKQLISVENNNETTRDGWTPLMVAVATEHYDIARYLMEHGALIHLKNQDGLSVGEMVLSQENIRSLEDSKKFNEFRLFFKRFFEERSQQRKERKKALKAEKLEAELNRKREENKKLYGIEAFLNKKFFALAKGKQLNLGADNNSDIQVTIEFMPYQKNLCMMSISFTHQKKPQKLELVLKPVSDLDNKITEFIFPNPRNLDSIAASTGYVGSSTNQANIIRIEKNISVEPGSDSGSFLLKAPMMTRNKEKKDRRFELAWELKAEELSLPTKNDNENIEPTNSLTKDTQNSTESVVPSKAKILPKFLEIPGFYKVILEGQEWGTAIVPDNLWEEELKLLFHLQQRDGSSKDSALYVKANLISADQLHSLYPLGGKDNKFIAGKTSFDKVIHVPATKSSKTRRKAKGVATPLCFTTPLISKERKHENDKEVILSADTTKGKLELLKISTEVPRTLEDNSSSSEEGSHSSSDEEDNSYEEILVHEPYHATHLKIVRDNQVNAENSQGFPEKAPQTKKRMAATKTLLAPYVDWEKFGLRETQQEQERAERDRRQNKEILLSRVNDCKENKAAPVTIEKAQQSIYQHEVHSTIYLSPSSRYSDCELVKDDIENSTWFGQAFILENGRLRKLPNKRLVLGMKNWLGYPRIGDNASWGSLMSTDLADRNYLLGKNVHISFHEQMYGARKVQYLNVSHHYRFELQKNDITGDYLLYQIAPTSDEQIVYVLSNKAPKKLRAQVRDLGIEALAAKARLYINWHPSWQERLEQLIDCEELNARALQLKRELISRDEVIGLGKSFLLHPLQNEGLIIRNNSEMPTEWNLLMINQNVGFIAVDYINPHRQERITKNFMFEIDSHGSMRFQ